MLYTRKGDKGDTYFFGSKKRVSKDSAQAEALGALDEINTLLGVCRAQSKSFEYKVIEKSLADIIKQVQEDIFIIGAIIAGADKKITDEKIKFLENIVDNIENKLPPIKTFFLPGGTKLSAFFDNARAVSRRTERRVVSYADTAKVDKNVLQYLNRLSSLLYALVRIINSEEKVEETPPSYI